VITPFDRRSWFAAVSDASIKDEDQKTGHLLHPLLMESVVVAMRIPKVTGWRDGAVSEASILVDVKMALGTQNDAVVDVRERGVCRP